MVKENSMKSTALALFASCIVLGACGSDPLPPPSAPPPAPVQPEPPPTQKPDDNPRFSNIQIADDIKKACGITDAEAFFAFDSANIREPDRVVLKKLAVCFSTGPLKGRQMRLVGHADPRGDEEYNRVLGQRRADNVKDGIASQGLDSAKIATTSRGEDDATGTDETTWNRDRRVDILLGD
jgi:peptidoglycan-associated lipoprotein